MHIRGEILVIVYLHIKNIYTPEILFNTKQHNLNTYVFNPSRLYDFKLDEKQSSLLDFVLLTKQEDLQRKFVLKRLL